MPLKVRRAKFCLLRSQRPVSCSVSSIGVRIAIMAQSRAYQHSPALEFRNSELTLENWMILIQLPSPSPRRFCGLWIASRRYESLGFPSWSTMHSPFRRTRSLYVRARLEHRRTLSPHTNTRGPLSSFTNHLLLSSFSRPSDSHSPAPHALLACFYLHSLPSLEKTKATVRPSPPALFLSSFIV